MKGGGGGGGSTVRIISKGSGGVLHKIFEIFLCAMRELLVQSEALMQG